MRWSADLSVHCIQFKERTRGGGDIKKYVGVLSASFIIEVLMSSFSIYIASHSFLGLDNRWDMRNRMRITLLNTTMLGAAQKKSFSIGREQFIQSDIIKV